jgi:hypothetical protein
LLIDKLATNLHQGSICGGPIVRFRHLIALALWPVIVCASPANSQTRATQAEITAAFVGNVATMTNKYNDRGSSSYSADGKYTYNDQFGSFQGIYKISDGATCLSFTSGKTHCDTIFKEGSSFILIDDETGDRFSLTFSRP